ncbi:MAG: TonB-dependent receptor [Tannerellaceae bacterium]|jgi:iron complex outermembrane receptor protein|nr:TonB-dependent receptor [Tannerellaceae bacterium]
MFAGRLFPAMIMSAFLCTVYAQDIDSVAMTVSLGDIVVGSEPYRRVVARSSSMSLEVADEGFLARHLTGNLTQTLEHLPGIHSMDIGSGFAKPVIRGMGFNRISVAENGIKQEGQQWGADHGLEIDAFGVGRITVLKGPASLLYGSDAMGGAIEISQPPPPGEDMIFGEVVALGKSVSGTVAGSVMVGVRHGGWHGRLRYSEQRHGDYHIAADTVVYLTQRMPVEGRRLKNTAGLERDASLYAGYRSGGYLSTYTVSNAYQRSGFFPGAHGLPDVSRLESDGDSRNVGFPYSLVNHLKIASGQQYACYGDDGGSVSVRLDAGYQRNDREEWSLFHTHYPGQAPPAADPGKELSFTLDTYSLSARLTASAANGFSHTAGLDAQYQANAIGGYSFLLPSYKRFTAGALWLASYRVSEAFSVSGGVRFDYGRLRSDAYHDGYLEAYLVGRGYEGERLAAYHWSSFPVTRDFGNLSGSVGFVFVMGGGHEVKSNIGRSYRLPGANELASNGVHHGAFRHEQGTPSLSAEEGWQWDVSYAYEGGGVSFSLTPFVALYDNYIYLRPTGEWSALPHAGQIYRYTGAGAFFAGGEAALSIAFLRRLRYDLSAGYVYTYNVDERIPLSFSPPPSMRNMLSFGAGRLTAWVELHSVASQGRVARNEDPTPGAHILGAGLSLSVGLGGGDAEVILSGANLFDKAFYNHLSFYRKVEIPEPGRNICLTIKLPFNNKLQ